MISGMTLIPGGIPQGRIGGDPDRREPPPAAALKQGNNASRRPITMFALIAAVVAVLVALAIFGLVVHVLFSPWLLLVAVAIVAWVKFRPNRSRR
jgi:Flp pilus assembly protein TadB